MAWLAIFLFTFLVQFGGIEASRYDIDDPAGIVSIVLLILAIIVCILSLIMFFYIIYKLWNENFARRPYYRRSISHEKFVMRDQIDGSRQSSMKTEHVHSYRNQVAVAEEAREELPAVEVTTFVQEDLKSEEVIVSQAPPTDQAEMETQELVVVFDDNDSVVDVLTHVT